MNLKKGFLGRHHNLELQRITLRAAQMEENYLEQAAYLWAQPPVKEDQKLGFA